MKIKKHLNFSALREKMSEVFNGIVDWRDAEKTQISIHDALMSGFACMYFQSPSLLQFQALIQEEQHKNNLHSLFDVKNIPKEMQMREIIDGVASDNFRPIFRDYYLWL